MTAGLQGIYTTTPPLPTMGDASWAIRWQLWLTAPVTDTYTLAVFADEGFNFSGIGPAWANTTTPDAENARLRPSAFRQARWTRGRSGRASRRGMRTPLRWARTESLPANMYAGPPLGCSVW